MRILIVSDAWKPQINGVVRALDAIGTELTDMGHEVQILGPDTTRPFVMGIPVYKKIELEFFGSARIAETIDSFKPDAIHIATEGPLGWAARNVCLRRGRPFTTSFHTRFPDYIAKNVPRFLAPFISEIVFAILQRFHACSSAVMVASLSLERELRSRGFRRVVLSPLGVDTKIFKPYGRSLPAYKDFPRPIVLYVGRIAREKNLRPFLRLKTPGTKVLIGEGPELAPLQKQYPEARFLGPMDKEKLARHYAAADLFVFPSKTDTFGLVLLEACASGLRVAAYPVAGPADVFAGDASQAFAVLNDDLQTAVDQALRLPERPEIPRAYAETFSWKAAAQQFLSHLAGNPTARL
jgi:glycosyltransferase involved in cell wall biosynthesis